MIHKLPDNVVEYLEYSEVVCAICDEPFGCSDELYGPDEYDCVWADELNGVMHEGCAESEIAYLENEGNCQVCIKNGTIGCPGDVTGKRQYDCFESRYK